MWIWCFASLRVALRSTSLIALLNFIFFAAWLETPLLHRHKLLIRRWVFKYFGSEDVRSAILSLHFDEVGRSWILVKWFRLTRLQFRLQIIFGKSVSAQIVCRVVPRRLWSKANRANWMRPFRLDWFPHSNGWLARWSPCAEPGRARRRLRAGTEWAGPSDSDVSWHQRFVALPRLQPGLQPGLSQLSSVWFEPGVRPGFARAASAASLSGQAVTVTTVTQGPVSWISPLTKLTDHWLKWAFINISLICFRVLNDLIDRGPKLRVQGSLAS